MTAIEVSGLTRHFHTGRRRRDRDVVVALDGVDFGVERREIHGLLGPNGAGKTTLVRILSTVLLPSGGAARILDHDVVEETQAVRRRIGIVFGGDRGLYPRLTPRRTLQYWSALYKLPSAVGAQRAEALLARVGLEEWADRRVETFSRGMKQRLHLARGLIGAPEVLFLDEPTFGMDPVAAHDFRELVTDLRAEGMTILLTTHDMAEAEAVCDRVSLIDSGRILATESPETLGRWLSKFERIDAEGVPAELAARVAELPGVVSVTDVAGGLRIETGEDGATRAVLRALVDGGVSTVRTASPSLEEVYLHVFGRKGMRV